jgi:hypothetical protein
VICEERSDAAIQEHQQDCFATLAMTMRLVAAVLLLCVAACRERSPPAPTSEQADQLNEAEDMLNNLATNEEGPEQRPGPSNSSE